MNTKWDAMTQQSALETVSNKLIHLMHENALKRYLNKCKCLYTNL